MNEGYIKFNCEWERREIDITNDLFQDLQINRSNLYELGLIGAYPGGVGFGNISVRENESTRFFITGSATGQFPVLDILHYSLVTGYHFEKNSLSCTGLTKASAESLTHAAIYEARPDSYAVVHIHHEKLWRKLLNKFPTTPETIEYGTPEMAKSVFELARECDFQFDKIIVMGGHPEGILAFGKTLDEATNQIINIYNTYKK